MKTDISVFIIAKNESATLPLCLESLKNFAQEVIVVDGFSTDDTLKIAQEYGAKTFQRTLESFTKQKQFALEQCTCKWVINMDADEQMEEPLKKEILEAIKTSDAALILLPNSNTFLGRKMKHSGLARQYKERMALREKARFEGGLVHEIMRADGKVQSLKNNYTHIPYRDIAHYFEKLNRYSSLGAQSMYDSGKKFHLINLLRQPLDFVKLYVFKLGFLDGMQGFLWALFSSYYPTVKYAKLWHLYHKKGK